MKLNTHDRTPRPQDSNFIKVLFLICAILIYSIFGLVSFVLFSFSASVCVELLQSVSGCGGRGVYERKKGIIYLQKSVFLLLYHKTQNFTICYSYNKCAILKFAYSQFVSPFAKL